MKLRMLLRIGMILFATATVMYAVRNKKSHGTFLKVPFDFRVPTPQKVRKHIWNPEDPRLFTPHIFGIGWVPNVYQVMQLVHQLRAACGAKK